MRALAILGLLAVSCSRPAPPVAPAPRVSRGWSSDTKGFVPDNSDAIAQGRKLAAARAAEPPPGPQPIRLRAGTAEKELTPAAFHELLSAQGGHAIPLAKIIDWAFPGKQWKTVQLVETRGGQVEVDYAAVVKDPGSYRVKLSRRDQLRVQLDAKAPLRVVSAAHGAQGAGIQRSQRSHIAEIRLL